ncbi:TPA: hypothetical protein DE059_03605 [Candidatus Peribacteria bacterium]|jgi:hypothetical protein|nr:hypothetical protein [Candidatus Peribacteria bacterium]
MAQRSVDKYLDNIEVLKIEIENNKHRILESFDLDSFLSNPENYLQTLSTEFISQHLDEVKDGHQAGKRFARSLLNGAK